MFYKKETSISNDCTSNYCIANQNSRNELSTKLNGNFSKRSIFRKKRKFTVMRFVSILTYMKKRFF